MIEITNLNFGYSSKKLLFENLNLKLKGGHIYGLLGQNGAGKSTLLKNITGLAFPVGGSCKVNGVESSRRLPSTLQELYLVPEEIYVPAIPIRKYVKLTAPFYPKFNQEQFDNYLKEFDVPADGKLDQLSLGQQKKAVLSFALATNTELLIMDEPTNGLDIPSKAQFRKIVASAFDSERCIIISTHQVRDLDNLIDTLVVVHDNKVVLNKSLDEIDENFSFRIIEEDEKENAIYFEDHLSGIAGMMPHQASKAGRVDLELLFNALMLNGTKIQNHLNN